MAHVSPILQELFCDLPPADALAARGGTGERLPTNTHVHLPPNFSAFESVAQAVDLARSQGIAVLGATNYYHYGVYSEYAERARRAGIVPLYGTEIIALLDDLAAAGVRINDPGNPGRLYICGMGITRFDPLTPLAARLLQDIRDRDGARMASMAARLDEVFAAAGLDAGLDEAALKARITARHGAPPEAVYLQERHLAQAYQEVMAERLGAEAAAAVLQRAYGAAPKAPIADAVATQNELRAQLMKAGKPAYVPETFVGFRHAYNLLLALGGIPCYPVLADGARPVCEFEQSVDALIEGIKAWGLHCVEFIPIRNTPEALVQYALAMRSAGLVVTAGTEHNTLELLPIEPRCASGVPVPEEVAEVFWEGTCVVTAHLLLRSQGLPGFVDETGAPTAGYGDGEARIRRFRDIGAAAVAAYRGT